MTPNPSEPIKIEGRSKQTRKTGGKHKRSPPSTPPLSPPLNAACDLEKLLRQPNKPPPPTHIVLGQERELVPFFSDADTDSNIHCSLTPTKPQLKKIKHPTSPVPDQNKVKRKNLSPKSLRILEERSEYAGPAYSLSPAPESLPQPSFIDSAQSTKFFSSPAPESLPQPSFLRSEAVCVPRSLKFDDFIQAFAQSQERNLVVSV